MTTYHYKGLTSNGAPVEGVIEAFDQQDAVNRSRANCRVLISVEPVNKSKFNNLMTADLGEMLNGGKVQPKKLALICSQLGIELKAGLPLVSSLQLVAENEPDKRLKRLMTEVADDVHAGNSLADSFALRGPYLPRTFIETIRAGEESGHLDDTFRRLQTYYEDSANVKSKVGSALIYPILLIVVAVVVIVIIMVKAVPVFESSFGSLGNELPGPTKALIAMSNFFVNNLLLIIVTVLILALGIFLFRKSDYGAHLFARLGLTFPGIGMVNRMNAASQFASTLGTMMAAGLPLVQAARLAADVSDNLLIGETISAAADGVTEGKRLTEGMRSSPWLPKLLVEMTAVGEETGKLEETLGVVNEYYTKEVDVAVSRALGILEPAIVMVMAAMVVFILLSVYLPLFSMYGSI